MKDRCVRRSLFIRLFVISAFLYQGLLPAANNGSSVEQRFTNIEARWEALKTPFRRNPTLISDPRYAPIIALDPAINSLMHQASAMGPYGNLVPAKRPDINVILDILDRKLEEKAHILTNILRQQYPNLLR